MIFTFARDFFSCMFRTSDTSQWRWNCNCTLERVEESAFSRRSLLRWPTIMMNSRTYRYVKSLKFEKVLSFAHLGVVYAWKTSENAHWASFANRYFRHPFVLHTHKSNNVPSTLEFNSWDLTFHLTSLFSSAHFFFRELWCLQWWESCAVSYKAGVDRHISLVE